MRFAARIVVPLAIGAASLLGLPAVEAGELRQMRLSDGPDGTRVVFDLDAPAGNDVFTLANPDRVVVDLVNVKRASALKLDPSGKGVVKAVRWGPHDGGLRIVFDMSTTVTPKSFNMDASGAYGYRVILDFCPAAVAPAGPAQEQAPSVPPPATVTAAARPRAVVDALLPPAAAPSPALLLTDKPIVVAVDAGHGGKDPGARGPGGLEEKDVTLAIARRLAQKIDATPGMRALLTRDGDYYVGLRERTEKARAAQADLFVSVHANSYKDRDMTGTAVYVLSDHGASTEQARWVAEHENAADLVGGVDLHDRDDKLAAVLVDISQSATMDASFDLGNRLLESLHRINSLEKPEVQQAGFMVLKSPDIPSVLVETAFISNPHEERMLRDPADQERFATSIFDGIRGYFSRYRPLQTVAAADGARKNLQARSAGKGKTIPVSLTKADGDDRAAQRTSAND